MRDAGRVAGLFRVGTSSSSVPAADADAAVVGLTALQLPARVVVVRHCASRGNGLQEVQGHLGVGVGRGMHRVRNPIGSCRHFRPLQIKSKRSEKFKAKKSKKMRKNAKNSEKMRKNRLQFCFALFRFEAKNTKVKRSEKFEAKISEKKRKKRSEIL